MQRTSVFLASLFCIGTAISAYGASKPHSVSFGKWSLVKISSGDAATAVKIRPVLVDARPREYSSGNPHEVTDRILVARRAFRVNDALPQESGLHWQWQQGGWMLIDRLTGRISQLNLPDFDASGDASWYRDYAAYCAVSEDGKKLYAIVAQLGRRKPVWKKEISEIRDGSHQSCPAPSWQRSPMAVTFEPEHSNALVFSLRSRAVQVTSDTDEDDGDR